MVHHRRNVHPRRRSTFASTNTVDPNIPDIDKFPHWVEPKNSRVSNPEYFDASLVDPDQDVGRLHQRQLPGDHLVEEYKEALTAHPDSAFIMTTGSRQPVYFHSEHRQLPWCRELWPVPRVEINPKDALELGIEQGDWVWIETERGKVRQVADLYHGIRPGTINCEHQWWLPEFHGATKVSTSSASTAW